MKKIIVHGNRHESYPKRFKCYRCGCIFETSDHKEYFISYELLSTISKCPECIFTSEEIERADI